MSQFDKQNHIKGQVIKNILMINKHLYGCKTINTASCGCKRIFVNAKEFLMAQRDYCCLYQEVCQIFVGAYFPSKFFSSFSSSAV
jgi:hypothetical protein